MKSTFTIACCFLAGLFSVGESDFISCSDPNTHEVDYLTQCIRTCQNRGMAVACLPVGDRGCACNDGYIWDEVSKSCVLVKDCPKMPINCKGPHTEPTPYTIRCPGTCDNIGKKYACMADLTKPGCKCTDGYRIDTVTGRCVSVDECLYVKKLRERH